VKGNRDYHVAKIFQISYIILLGACLFVAACKPHGPASGLVFEEAWVRSLPPGMKMTAGFGILRNPEPATIEITSFASPSFGDVSLHRTEVVDGVSKMREVPVLTIAAGATVVLEPGSYHLMLMMPAGDFKPGQSVVVEFIASDGRSFSFEVPVERR
jgi:copper(I)-binding protein